MKLFGHKLISMQGRMNRAPFFQIFLTFWVINTVVFMLTASALSGVLVLLECVMFFTMHVRRLHDLNKSGWWILVELIPIVNIFFILYLFLSKGTTGGNDYGPDPLA